MALEEYIAEKSSTRCRWHYKRETTGLYSEAILLLYFETTKKVDLKINYTNGVLLVQGEHYKQWVKSEFPKVKRFFDSMTQCPEESVAATRKSSVPTTLNDM